MANPGYGKHSAPGQTARRKGDFAHLPRREAAIAALIDRLPEGAAMDAKTLAKESPEYGQAACRTALKRLTEAGHLRRVKEHLLTEDGKRWVTRTYFSRTARDDAWWAGFLRGDVPDEDEAPAPAPPPPPPAGRPAQSRAYAVLARLIRTDSRLALSAAECAALEPLAAEWLARGATEPEIIRALTERLPPEVESPGGLTRRRLIDRLPPEREPEPEPRPAPLRYMECAVCGVPGRPEALPGGLCRDCRGEPRPPEPPERADEVRARVAELRAAARSSERIRA
ncbi:hypothetical protein [Streptomyces sp. NPDC053048]|uniref:hypothetical protein n=1 Tax=Streptomyces sp. NPDC053048 TaxID=3365694 RepID=UPI0037CD47B4